MLPLLVAALLTAAWAPTTEFNGVCRALPTWADEYARVRLPPQLITSLWFSWHLHSTYAILRAPELDEGLLSRTLLGWCAIKFWASSFFGQSVLLLGYFAAALSMLAAGAAQFKGATDATEIDHALDTWAGLTLALFALWNLDVFQRIMRQKRRTPVVRTAMSGLSAPARRAKKSTQRRRLVQSDKRWQPAGASKR